MKNNLNTFRHWIFDLDGTLADTADDIVESLADTCEQVLGNRPEMDSSWIGPPLPDMIRRIDPAISQERITQIVLLFREKYFSSAFPATRLSEASGKRHQQIAPGKKPQSKVKSG